MADTNTETLENQVENQDDEPVLVTLEDAEGNQHSFEVIDIVTHTWQGEERDYALLVPQITDPDSEDDEDAVLILQLVDGDELRLIEDEDEFEAISKHLESLAEAA